MVKVITYGSYDMLHYGHIRLLERAKALGDYLIVGVTSDDYDKIRGKINLQQSLTERIDAIRSTGLADLILIEEYEGQKIDDIKRYDVDVFTVGSDWEGYFDYLKEYCQVIYLPRTKGISSTKLRSEERAVRIGLIGSNESRVLSKYCAEAKFVNGAEISALCTMDEEVRRLHSDIPYVTKYEELLEKSDAIYILTHPCAHYEYIKKALNCGKHVLVEMPVVLDVHHYQELQQMAIKKNLILMPAMKTAYATAYNRLLLLLKAGKIGKILSVDAVCTSIRETFKEDYSNIWNSISAWGPTALMAVFHILGTKYEESQISSFCLDKENYFDAFTKIDFYYNQAVASIKVGRGVKSEGELVVSGTDGYIYVPAPWWKTDYFEVRYENPENNKRYFYQLDGEGIRYELVAFMKAIKTGKKPDYITDDIAKEITKIMMDFYMGKVRYIT